MTDHIQEQEMEVEALEAILMDDFKEIHSGESGLDTSNRCFQITLSPQDDEADETVNIPVQLGLIFSHTEKYPDEPPLINVKSIRGIQPVDLKILKEKLQKESNCRLKISLSDAFPSIAKALEGLCTLIRVDCRGNDIASENLGMAMIYTLVTSAQDWLSEKFSQDTSFENSEAIAEKDEIIIPHGEPVTVDSFSAWRERFEAEIALERAKVMPDSALTAPKDKRLTGRQYFESGRASLKGAAAATGESEEEDEEDIDFDDDDFEDDEDDMLEHYLAEKSDSSLHSSRQPA